MNDLVTTASFGNKEKKIAITSVPLKIYKNSNKNSGYYVDESVKDIQSLKRLFRKSIDFMNVYSSLITSLTVSEIEYLTEFIETNIQGEEASRKCDTRIKKFVEKKSMTVDILNYKTKDERDMESWHPFVSYYIITDYYVIREEILSFLMSTSRDSKVIQILSKLFGEDGNCSTFEEYLDKKSKELISLDVDSFLDGLRKYERGDNNAKTDSG